MSNYIEHLESHLGLISGGYRGDGLQVIYSEAGLPFEGVRTLVTAGLGRLDLDLPDGSTVRQELVMHVPAGAAYQDRTAALLLQVAKRMADRRTALRTHQVLGPFGPLFPGTSMTALVAAPPQYLPETFAAWRGEEPPIIMAWLFPITTAEAGLVAEHGWDELEKILIAEDPDLSNPERPEVTLR
ncbi:MULTISPECIES: suppressor of fused domain protein [Actinoplanes]|uniref:Suppressor of fused-like domain-containing protein n=2 Tax=Actinoplanes TaxID=1865 RepID=A0A0X3V6B8_9ACTN|nr:MULTISPECIES: suppressor of fused domain protein [Actinoplanes]KUL39987.1 hypothetical protein ADL15_08015 [Actinoplanes awajinensis subsp. mycoplanecinus]GIE73555.1 hypothetical protein Apa02nite_096630 [Actinoplanes palleronii]